MKNQVLKKYVLSDKNHTRITLVQTRKGIEHNWLFLAGGPGADSAYFNELIEILDIPGNIWLVDLPENGGNKTGVNHRADFDFNSWEAALKYVLKSLSNVILVGHSFSGIYPLLFPEIEKDLLGLVILNSAASPWVEEAIKKAQSRNLPSFEKEMAEFFPYKNRDDFNRAMKIFVHYYFNPETLEKGSQILSRSEFNFYALNWWLSQASKINFEQLLVPSIPTLILGGSEDCAVPFNGYLEDHRFKKENIIIQEIQGASHFPWLEKPNEVKQAFDDYLQMLSTFNH